LPAEKPIPTVTEICLARHAEELYRGREKTLDHIRRTIRRLRTLYGTVSADEFGPVALKAHRAKLLKERDLSRTYANEQIRRIKQIFAGRRAKN
jgi:hypothetical protein